MSGNEKNPPDKDLSEIENALDDFVPDLKRPSYDVPLDVLLSGEANTLDPDEVKKLKQIGYGALAVILIVVALVFYSSQPKNGSMAFAICSTFLELNTPYPHTLNYTDLEGSRTAVRIYFTNTDPFGEYKLEMMECTFGPDEKTGMKLTQVTRNRRPVDAAIVREFNITLPAIIASDPYRILPPDWKNQLIPD